MQRTPRAQRTRRQQVPEDFGNGDLKLVAQLDIVVRVDLREAALCSLNISVRPAIVYAPMLRGGAGPTRARGHGCIAQRVGRWRPADTSTSSASARSSK